MASNEVKGHKRNRSIASDDPENDYLTWAGRHDELARFGDRIRVGGLMLAGRAAYTGIGAPAAIPMVLGANTIAGVLDQFNKLTEVPASLYAAQLIKKNFDLVALKKVRDSGKTPEEKQEKLAIELKRQAAGMSDAAKFMDHDAIAALNAGLDNAIKYSSYLEAKTDRQGADIDALKKGFINAQKNQTKMIRHFNDGMKTLGTHVEGLAQDLNRLANTQDGRFNFFMAMQENKMNAEQKIYAIKNLGYGTFKPGEKEATLEYLNRLKKFQDAEKWIAQTN